VRYSPFDRPLSEITVDHVRELVPRDVKEGLFVEYKSEWSADKIARAVASFANSEHGGTLIVGMVATGLSPSKLEGFTFNRDPSESAVQVIRDLIAPIPASFLPVALTLEDGRFCLLIEVHPGADPPYIHIRSGTILVRTPTSSDPQRITDRSHLDLLFARGRGGEEWALSQAPSRTPFYTENMKPGVVLSTAPAVLNGLMLHASIFQNSFLDSIQATLAVPFETPGWRAAPNEMTGDQVTVARRDHLQGQCSIAVFVTGTVTTQWRIGDPIKFPLLEEFLRVCLPTHRRILEEIIGYRGRVALCLSTYLQELGKPLMPGAKVAAVQQLSEKSYIDYLIRDCLRHLGYPEAEPEE
jgi:hypothetical protein